MSIECLRHLYCYLKNKQRFNEENAKFSFEPMLGDLQDFFIEIENE